MPLTRQPARASFTFEVKRANRRSPEVFTLSKSPVPTGSSLAHQVFGGASAPVRDLRPEVAQHEAPARPTISSPHAAPGEKELTKSGSLAPRRILPDLLAITVNPVAERARQEAEERVARKVSRASAATKRSASSVLSSGDQSDLPEQKLASEIVLPVAPIVLDHDPAKAVKPSLQGTSSTLRRGIKKAQRNGEPLPRLPAGQRWKRRLPMVCW
jgi:hypothetical protein